MGIPPVSLVRRPYRAGKNFGAFGNPGFRFVVLRTTLLHPAMGCLGLSGQSGLGSAGRSRQCGDGAAASRWRLRFLTLERHHGLPAARTESEFGWRLLFVGRLPADGQLVPIKLIDRVQASALIRANAPTGKE